MSKRQEVKVLDRAAELLAKGWCRGTYARDSKGNECMTTSPKAVTFCMVGALMRAAKDLKIKKDWNISCKLESEISALLDQHVPHFNDNNERTQEEVVDFLLNVRYSL